eukprot:TRINITY_DN10688_c0_g4_i1.p1 TRINITY_DN10688_c0_g4~~TRINITY_DN10688_c0_g4_i1.p1  ORF type:complete len:186 (-),score=25.81 TRINITY_DN10688_c0_g4_i1:1260-1817(-)
MSLVPPRVEVFCWLAATGKISTVDILRMRASLRLPCLIFALFVGKRMRQSHLLLHCEVSASIWSFILEGCGVSWCMPHSLDSILENWLRCGKINWNPVPYAIIWSIWKERNSPIFRNAAASPRDVLDVVKVRIGKWVMLRKEFKIFNLDIILINWEAYMIGRPFKVKKQEQWSPPPAGVLQFNVG